MTDIEELTRQTILYWIDQLDQEVILELEQSHFNWREYLPPHLKKHKDAYIKKFMKQHFQDA